MATRTEPDGFGHFFRQYTKTWMHAVATAGLTAFGTLTFVHRGFAVLAVASYVVPPVVLYVSRRRGTDAHRGTESNGAQSPTDAALSDREPESNREDAASSLERQVETDPSTVPSESGPREADDATGPGVGVDESSGASPANADESPRERDDKRERTTETVSESATADPESDADAPTDDTDADTDSTPRWRRVDTPTDAALFDAAITATGALAVGASGIVIESADEGDDGWDVLLADGPGAQSQDLRGVDTTANGAVAWVAGDGGAVGRLEVATGRHTDYSAPDDRTDNLAGIAVAGSSGDETVFLINGSGELLRGRYREDDLSWAGPTTPGSGSSLSGVDLADEPHGYCCDTNDGVFETVDGGETFETIGLEGADGTLTDVVAGGRADCHASADDGVVHRYDGTAWTPERVDAAAVSAIDRHENRLVACGADGGVHTRTGSTADWERHETGADGTLEGVAVGDGRIVAVGVEGTVIERR